MSDAVRAAARATVVAACVAFPLLPAAARADDATPAPTVDAPAPQPTEPTGAFAAAAAAVAAGNAQETLDEAERARLRTFATLRLRFDAFDGVAYEGASTSPLARQDLFARLGRQDLVAEEAARKTKRVVFYAAAGAALVTGMVAGLVIFNNGPDLYGPECMDRFGVTSNACGVRHQRADTMSGVALVSGFLAASGLFAIGWSFGESPLSKEQTESLVAGYNGEVMQRLRTTTAAPRTPGTRLELSPQMSASGGGLLGRLTF